MVDRETGHTACNGLLGWVGATVPTGLDSPSWGLVHSRESRSPHDPGPPTEYLPVLGSLSCPTRKADAADRDRERAAALEALRKKEIPSDDYLDFLDRVLHGLRRL